MEREFREYIIDRVDGFIIKNSQFVGVKKIKLGVLHPGSRIWRWVLGNNFCAYIALVFYLDRNCVDIGVGWSKKVGGIIEFSVADEASRNRLDCIESILDHDQGIGLLDGLDEVYVGWGNFPGLNVGNRWIDDLIPLERARVIYGDPAILKMVVESAGISEQDWEKDKPIRYWEIAKCFINNPVIQEDCEHATGHVWREMTNFLHRDGLPFLNRAAKLLAGV